MRPAINCFGNAPTHRLLLVYYSLPRFDEYYMRNARPLHIHLRYAKRGLRHALYSLFYGLR